METFARSSTWHLTCMVRHCELPLIPPNEKMMYVVDIDKNGKVDSKEMEQIVTVGVD